MAAAGIGALQKLDRDFKAYWPLRNKGTTAKCSTFLRWRMHVTDAQAEFVYRGQLRAQRNLSDGREA